MTRGELVMVALCTFALLGRMGLQAQAGFTRYTVRGAPRVDLHAVSGAVAFVQERVRLAPARVIGLEADLYAGWTGTYALEGISGPDALMAPHYRELALASPLLREWDWRFYLSADRLASARRFLDFLNVRHYFIRTKDAPAAVKSGLALCHAADFEVYESTTAWPRAFFTNHVTLYNDVGQLADQIQRGDGRPFAAVRAQDLPKSNEIPGLPTHLASRTVVAATDYRLTENTTSFELTAPARGIVVLGETNWRGYSTAEIDGRPVNVWRVNHVFQGIAVEPGLHRVTFRYQPENWDVALKLSITGLGLLLASGAIAWRAGRRSV